mgnify:CR=1 FL=1
MTSPKELLTFPLLPPLDRIRLGMFVAGCQLTKDHDELDRKPLLDWLTAYTFPADARFSDVAHAREIAVRYLDENLRNGITTAAVFGTVHATSVDALFEAIPTGVGSRGAISSTL